jgi:3-oxoacyl-[acyl-carrier-protein] synthase-3
MFSIGHSRILGIGIYLPENRVTSAELMDEIKTKERFGISSSWLERATGIRERRIAPAGMMPSDIATQAANDAIERSGISPSRIDAVIYAGMNRDYLEPATAHIVQDAVGAKRALCFDITNACHGFMNAIHVVDSFIASGQARVGLIVTGEENWRVGRSALEVLKQCNDRAEFNRLVGGLTVGDAGAAMIVGPKTDPQGGFAGLMLESQGRFNQLCVFSERKDRPCGHMDMVSIVKEHIQLHADMYPQFMHRLRWHPGEIKKFVHHQVGRKVFALHSKYSGVPQERMTDTVSSLGNITSATIPVNLRLLAEQHDVSEGEKIFIAGAGSGLSVSQGGLVWQEAA